jgi:hypothetical protein
MRFDEVELRSVEMSEALEPVAPQPVVGAASDDASRPRRLFALLTDLSLFVALALALSPLLPSAFSWTAVLALGGFVIMTSYYYFAGAWLLWGKTIGGAIFDVRVVPDGDDAMSFYAATMRWAGLYASLLIGGAGFLLALMPGRRSLPDRLSATRCVAAH